MRKIITPERMRAAEQKEFESGTPSIDVMERAARYVAKAVMEMAGGRRALFMCGTGNNGGDGLAAARLYYEMGGFSDVCLLGEQDKMTADARVNLTRWLAIGPVLLPEAAFARGPKLLVDALFGTGLSRAPGGEYASCIERMNESGIPVLAVDIPSGVDARDGSTPGAAVHAARTVTFHTMKPGHVFFPGRELCGEIKTADIGLRDEPDPGDIDVLDDEAAGAMLPRRRMDSHKGTYGHPLIVAGSLGMAGAAALCARGALHAGAGLVTVACPEKSVLPVIQRLAPEAMCLPLKESGGAFSPDVYRDIRKALEGRSVTAVGPGLRMGEGSEAAVVACIEAGLPCVFDADALNSIAAKPDIWKENANAVLTPHPGEAARLLGRPCGHAVDDARILSEKFGAVVLLKGASTVAADPAGKVTVNLTGTPAMARGGSGDVLTGVIAALLAQGLCAYDAARLGAYLHGRAGQRAERRHGIGFTAMKLADYLFSE